MRLTDIFRHPVKSLGTETLTSIELTAGRAMPSDRAFALTHGASAFDKAAPAWAHCSNFVRVANVPGLAAIAVDYDASRTTFHGRHPELGELVADLSSADGRRALADWVAPMVEPIAPGPIDIVSVPDRALTDADAEAVSIHCHPSLRALSERVGAVLDPRRFRGNLWIDADGGLAPGAEGDWVGRTVSIGTVRLRVMEPIERCLAPSANPETGRRDVHPTRALKAGYGEAEFGVLAEVMVGGVVSSGDQVSIS